jgi:GTP-binding protein LepA
VVYEVTLENGDEIVVTNPSEFPGGKIKKIMEPLVRATILSPKDYVGTIMELCQSRRGTMIDMQYLGEDRVQLR